MSNAEIRKGTTKVTGRNGLEDLGRGIKGRVIPPEELNLNKDQVIKLAEESNSDAFAQFLYSIYKIKPPEKKK